MGFLLKGNQVIYSSSPVRTSSFQALAQTVFDVYYYITKEIALEKDFDISSKVNEVIYSSSPISTLSFKALSQIVFDISSDKISLSLYYKGHNSGKICFFFRI